MTGIWRWPWKIKFPCQDIVNNFKHCKLDAILVELKNGKICVESFFGGNSEFHNRTRSHERRRRSRIIFSEKQQYLNFKMVGDLGIYSSYSIWYEFGHYMIERPKLKKSVYKYMLTRYNGLPMTAPTHPATPDTNAVLMMFVSPLAFKVSLYLLAKLYEPSLVPLSTTWKPRAVTRPDCSANIPSCRAIWYAAWKVLR